MSASASATGHHEHWHLLSLLAGSLLEPGPASRISAAERGVPKVDLANFAWARRL